MNQIIEQKLAELKELITNDENIIMLIIMQDETDTIIQGYGCAICLIEIILRWVKENNIQHSGQEEMTLN